MSQACAGTQQVSQLLNSRSALVLMRTVSVTPTNSLWGTKGIFTPFCSRVYLMERKGNLKRQLQGLPMISHRSTNFIEEVPRHQQVCKEICQLQFYSPFPETLVLERFLFWACHEYLPARMSAPCAYSASRGHKMAMQPLEARLTNSCELPCWCREKKQRAPQRPASVLNC